MEIKSAISLIGPAVGNHLWQSTVFAAAVWLVTLLLRRNAARVRFWLWLAASVKFLVPFSLLIAVGGLLPRQHLMPTVTPITVYSAVNAVGQPFADFSFDTTDSSAQRLSLMERVKVDLPVVPAVVWFCGALVVLTVWLVRWRQMRTMLGRAVRAEGGREFEILRGMSGGDGVELMLSRDLMEPGIFGVFRPVLIWPVALSARLEDAHVEAIFAHELMHVRRRDNLAAMLHMLVEAVFWFHLMVWWMERRLVEERELACDEGVVGTGGNAETYAESLLKACRFCVEAPMVCVAGITGADLCKRVRSIMTVRLEKLSLSKKLMLLAAALLSIVVPVAFGALSADASQSAPMHSPAAAAPAFDVASVRQNDSPQSARSHIYNSWKDSRFRAINVPLSMLVSFAYGLPEARILNLPEWAREDKFDIEAKSDSAMDARMSGMDLDASRELKREMLQALLRERFGLAAQRETRVMPVYEMVAAKGGAKLVASTLTGDRHFDTSRGYMVLKGTTTADLAAQLALVVGRVVIDKTGIVGQYDVTLQWARDESAAPAGAEDSGPSIFTVVQEQLGLKLESAKAPVEVLVVEHVERATEN